MGENRETRAEEIATLRLGLDLGATLIDTAEMYGDGQSEELIGEALENRRDEAFLVSKVYPHNASRRLVAFAKDNGMTPAQAALAWLLSHNDVIVIPKTGHRERLKENISALEHRLTNAQLAELDRLFPPPAKSTRLEML